VNLDQTVREACARFGERSAYVSPTGWEMSYAALDTLADEVAAGLAAAGIAEGAVVTATMPPRPEYIVLQVATARVGAALAGINHKLAGPEQAALLELCEPALVLAGNDPAASADEALADLRGHGTAPPPLPPDPERPLAIVFTSGTTGTPRGAVYAQRQVDFITRVDTGGAWGDADTPGPHGMSGMSLTHLGPTTKLQGNLMRGGTTHLLERWSPTAALELVERHGMPVIAGVPTQVTLMLHHPDFERFDTSSVRAVVMGGGPAKPALVREIRERLGVPVMVRYSCTEAGIGVGTMASDDPSDAECSVGRPHEGVELTIRSESGKPLPDGELGEVCLKSPATMSGYWRDPAATDAARWPDGSIRTGDLGSIDESGRLHLAGRAGEMYVRGGYNVHPGEVEAVLAGCPGVADVAVVGLPDDVMGEIGAAVVVAEERSEPPSLDSLRAFGESGLARHKLPEAIVVVDQLPLTPMEKLDRRALRDLFERSPAEGAGDTGGAVS
jgi:acyl-CoA synthetase (AMP-forming)/AMP-acid ligase II